MNRASVLPPLSAYPSASSLPIVNGGINNNQYLNYISQRTGEHRSNTPSNPYGQIEESSNHNLAKEINNIKQVLKNQFENQHELQNKIIEYNRIISQQDNIIRLNNIKLNEHDTKLTEILMSFSNFLKYQEKTTNVLNQCQNQIDNNLIKVKDFQDFKGLMLNYKQSTDNKVSNIINNSNEFLMRLNEYREENKNYHKYACDKIKKLEDDGGNNIIDYKSSTLKTIENNNETIQTQTNQLKGLIQLVETNLNEETKCRKFSIESFYGDVKRLIKENDTKFSIVEKSQLETEKNGINGNKNYMYTFKEGISKQKDANEVEFRALRSMIDAATLKIRGELESSLNSTNSNGNNVKCDINQQRTVIDELELFVKENIKVIGNKADGNDKNSLGSNNKMNLLSKSLDQFAASNQKMGDDKIKEIKHTYDKKIENLTQEMRTDFMIRTNDNEKNINDLYDKISHLQETIMNDAMFKGKVDLGADKEYVDKEIKNLNMAIDHIESKIKTEMQDEMDKFQLNLNNRIGNFGDILNDMITKKIQIANQDIEEEKNKKELMYDGRLQEYIGEVERRGHDYYDKEILDMKIIIENLKLNEKYDSKTNNQLQQFNSK